MELISTVESLSYHVEGFADQIDEIGSWMSSFNQGPKTRNHYKGRLRNDQERMPVDHSQCSSCHLSD